MPFGEKERHMVTCCAFGVFYCLSSISVRSSLCDIPPPITPTFFFFFFLFSFSFCLPYFFSFLFPMGFFVCVWWGALTKQLRYPLVSIQSYRRFFFLSWRSLCMLIDRLLPGILPSGSFQLYFPYSPLA